MQVQRNKIIVYNWYFTKNMDQLFYIDSIHWILITIDGGSRLLFDTASSSLYIDNNW